MQFIKASICIFFLVCCNMLHAQNWDVNITKSVNPQQPNSFIFKGLSASAYPVSIATPVTLLIAGKLLKDKQTFHNGAEMLISAGGAAVATEVVKIIINRQRPYQHYSGVFPYQIEDGKSLPSGHTSLAFATATSLTLECKKWYITVPAYAWAAGIGYSRLYLGEHYFTDVVAGAAIGAASAIASRWVTKKLFKY